MKNASGIKTNPGNRFYLEVASYFLSQNINRNFIESMLTTELIYGLQLSFPILISFSQPIPKSSGESNDASYCFSKSYLP